MSSFYPKYPHQQLPKRVRHLNNRDLFIFMGVFFGAVVAIYGICYGNFSSIAVLGTALGQHNWGFKLLAIILSAGTFGNLLSYVGACLDIITNHRTIFDLIEWLWYRLPFKNNNQCELSKQN